MNINKDYEGLTNVVLTNIYTLSKKNKRIEMYNFNFKDIYYLYTLECCKTISIIKQFPIYINCNFFTFLYYKLFKKGFKELKWISKANITNSIIPYDLLRHVSNANKKPFEIWIDIYNNFFKGDK